MNRYRKLLFLDTETTGLYEYKHDPYQIAMIIEIDGEVVDQKEFYSQPIRWENIDQRALDTNGTTKEMLKSYPHPSDTYSQIQSLLSYHVDKFNKNDKFIAVGQNVRFDLNMMRSWFKNAGGDTYWGSFVDSTHPLDTVEAAKWLQYVGLIPQLENNKLKTICDALDIKFNAHDALSDIIATRELFKKFTQMIGGI